METLTAARAPKLKSTWDRDASLTEIRAGSATHQRLYSDATGPKRNARATRERENIAKSRPPPPSKPEGYELMTNRPEMFNESKKRAVKYTERGPDHPSLTARGRDMALAAAMSKKKADFGSGHPMWSPYYRPTGKTEDGKPIIPIDYFKQTSREVGSYKTDPNLVELGPKMLEANAVLARNIKQEIDFNPYPKHFNVTPRDSSGKPKYEKVNISKKELERMHKTFFVSDRPAQDDEFVRKFTKHMYDQFHKKMSTLAMTGDDPFKLSKEEMFKMKNEAKYSSKFVGPCFDMGHRPNYNYDEFHGGSQTDVG
ncbi:hypothetical protein TrLO_g10572 [Triparma laevis f. longispina]|uniref:Uncharacterized protein n=1 Tax=Triparma laevis f. longispina TaxID=1714387 RepID=A0A9W7FU09_9STRA|nr:hypothetical protein TrLO_g10572 [Triparma laevis f. longispina]